MTRAIVASWLVGALALVACGKSDAPPPSPVTTAPQAPTPPAPPPPAPRPPPVLPVSVDGAYVLPTASSVAPLPTDATAYVFLGADEAVRANRQPVIAEATQVGALSDLQATIAALPAGGGRRTDVDAGVAASGGDAGSDPLEGISGSGGWGLATGPYGTIHGGGGNIGSVGAGYGVGLETWFLTAERQGTASGTTMLVGDRAASTDLVARTVYALGSGARIAVDAGQGARAFALSLRKGDSPYGERLHVWVQHDGEVGVFGAPGAPTVVIAPGEGGVIDRDAVARAFAQARATPERRAVPVEISFERRVPLQRLVAMLDVVAGSDPDLETVHVRVSLRALAGRTPHVPQIRIGQPSATGGELDKAIIRRYIKRNIAKITYCYEKRLLVDPTLAGTVTVEFVIGTDGNVAIATGRDVDPAVATCVAGVIKAIDFPKPKGGGVVQVTYPFTFSPSGG